MAPTKKTLLLFLLLVLLFSSLLLQPSYAADRLRLGESIVSNQTLSSGSSTFLLGFFSPSNTPSTSYLGVWCSGSDVRTAVWVANRNAPIPLSHAIFRLSNSSNLEVADSNGTLLWSSGTHSSDPNTVAVTLDSGNLVLRSEGGAILWQGFDHPTDTVLPGLPIWANYKKHVASTATSWRSPDDPSPGEFHLSIDAETPLQGIIRRGSAKWWRGNLWAGDSYTVTSPDDSSYVPYLSFTISPDTWNISFTSSYLGVMAWRLDHNGTAVISVWLPRPKQWQPVYVFNAEPCEIYGICGAYGYCSPAPPMCRCLDGFDPRNRSEWDNGDYRSGCVRIYNLTCDGRDEFVKLEKMKLPDYNTYLRSVRNGSACREACRSNCSCVGYAYSDLWTGSETVPRCLVWVRELVDLVTRTNRSGGENLYLRVSVPPDLGSKKDVKVIIIVSLLAGGAVVAAVLCSIWSCRKHHGEEGSLPFNIMMDDQDTSIWNGEEIDQRLPNVFLLNYEIVVTATNNFSDQNKIGQGGFGIVYKGVLPRGQEVAIKRLTHESEQGLDEFKNEVVLIGKLQHRNLVKLLYCCINGEEKLLIYEYMPNKSLELLLFDSENQRILDWGKRFNIIKGIAKGLRYLHEDSRLKIIHRDLKASNVLLDQDMNPKISDFGMARIFGGDQTQANTRLVVGTYGYMSPEYAMEGVFSVKSDIYSFGVLLLEIISSRRNSSFRSRADFPSLLSYAWESWKSNTVMQMAAPSIHDSSSSWPEVIKCAHIGLLCVHDDPARRPNMSSVVFMLENDTPLTVMPEEPTFTSWRCQDEDSTRRSRNTEASSINDLSTAVDTGR